MKVLKEQQGDTLILRLSGPITEKADFRALCGFPLPKKVRINTKEVDRINSEGVRLWMIYFRDVVREGSELTFFECSVPIVEQANLVMNFLNGGKVESAYVPFACPSCKSRLVGLLPIEELRRIRASKVMADISCVKCGTGKAVFDDLKDEYFRFVDRQ